MADFIDDAQAVNELHQEVSLRNQAARLAPEAQPGYALWDGLNCLDCEEEIPLQRRKMKRCRCMPCQEFLEKRTALAKHNIKAEEET